MQGFVDTYVAHGPGIEAMDHIADPDGEIWSQFQIRTQPSFVVINDNGESETFQRSLSVDGLRDEIETLLAT